MNKKSKLFLLAGSGVILYVSLFTMVQLYLVHSIRIRRKETLPEALRGISPEFSLVVFLSAFFVMILWAYFTVYIIKNSRLEEMRFANHAMRMANSPWYVEYNKELDDVNGKKVNVIHLSHVSYGKWQERIPIRPGHPDVEEFRKLKPGDIVEFVALTHCMDCALEHELSGFLRIKSVC